MFGYRANVLNSIIMRTPKKQPGRLDLRKKEEAKKVKPLSEKPKVQKDAEAIQVLHTPMLQGTLVAVPPKQPTKTYKLKITTTDIQCISSSDSDKIDDYEITQSIYYETKKGVKRPVKRTASAIRDGIGDNSSESMLKWLVANDNSFSGQFSPGSEKHRNPVPGLNTLVRFEENKQLHVKQGNGRGIKNINNSMTFEITQEELDDKQAKMIIYTRVIEKSSSSLAIVEGFKSSDIFYNYDGYERAVALTDVLRILTGKRKLNATIPYFETTIAKGIKFDDFDGMVLPLTRVDYPDKIILEGPIRARGKTAANKAAIWVRFE